MQKESVKKQVFFVNEEINYYACYNYMLHH